MSLAKKAAVVTATALTAGLCLTLLAGPASAEEAVVTRVIDGDTVTW